MSPRTAKQFEDIRIEKKQQILEVALRLFANMGFHETSISKIAKEAGISKGLLYNYFESKESLLQEIMLSFTETIMTLMNPDHDDEITSLEMEDFFTLIIDLLKSNKEQWKLYHQISMQQGVNDFFSFHSSDARMKKNQSLIYKYFAERFENPQLELFIFSSMFKGFSVQYVFAMEEIPDEITREFKKRLKEMFIRPKK
jgi:AcrR family transcriptional regulator